MQRPTGGFTLRSVARGPPFTTSSAYVIGGDTMRDQPAVSHPCISSFSPEDHTALGTGKKRHGKGGSAAKGGSGGGSGTKGGIEAEGASESAPQGAPHPHWCLQSLHTNAELAANGDAGLETSNSNRTDDLSRIYFPWTLGAPASGLRLPPATPVVDPGACVRCTNAGQGHQRSRPSSHRCGRCGTGLSSSSSASNSSYDRVRPSSAHDDSRPGSHQKVLLSSPFESTLLQLRLDRLRIEEEHLLEIKRQEELERTRVPLPKWYALKSSQFGRELKRHNDLLKSRDNWQDQVDYRATLEKASHNFQQAFYSGGQ